MTIPYIIAVVIVFSITTQTTVDTTPQQGAVERLSRSAYITHGIAALKSHNFDNAAEAFRNANASDATCVTAVIGYFLAQYLRGSSDPKKEDQSWRRDLPSVRDDLRNSIERATSRISSLSLDKQVQAVITLLESHHKADKCCDAAIEHLRKGELDKAIEETNAAVILIPDYGVAYELRGMAWTRKPEWDKACDDFSVAIKLNPKDYSIHSQRGWVWFWRGNIEKACADFGEAIRLNPTDGRVRCARGIALSTAGEFDKALEDLTAAIGINSKDAATFFWRGKTWLAKHELDKAIEDLTVAIRLDSEDAVALAYRSLAWFGKSEYDQALRDANAALKLDGNCASAYLLRGSCHASTGKTSDAIDDLTCIIRLAPKNAGAYMMRAVELRKLGRTTEADNDISRAKHLGLELTDDTDRKQLVFGTIKILTEMNALEEGADYKTHSEHRPSAKRK